jgi:hypothetical protein
MTATERAPSLTLINIDLHNTRLHPGSWLLLQETDIQPLIMCLTMYAPDT